MAEKESSFEQKSSVEKKESQKIIAEKQSPLFKEVELREINPEFVKDVEVSELFEDSKVDFLLTARGLKPASEITEMIKSKIEGENYSVFKSDDDMRRKVSLIEKSGIPFKEGKGIEYFSHIRPDGQIKKGEIEYMEILLGSTEQKLKILEEAMKFKKEARELIKSGKISESAKKEINLKWQEELGLALGFPPTAVEAWTGRRETANTEDLSQEVRESDAFLFSPKVLSKDNWKEEIKQGQIYADYIKSASPDIYKKYVDFKKQHKL